MSCVEPDTPPGDPGNMIGAFIGTWNKLMSLKLTTEIGSIWDGIWDILDVGCNGKELDGNMNCHDATLIFDRQI